MIMTRIAPLILFAAVFAVLCTTAWAEPGTVHHLRTADGLLQSRLETLPTASQPGSAVAAAGPVQYGPVACDDFTGQLLWTVNDPVGMCNNTAVSPEGNWMALGITLNNQRAESYQTSSGVPLWTYPVGDGNACVALSQNGEVYALGHTHYLSVFHANSGTPLWTYDLGASSWAYTVVVSRDGARVVVASKEGTTGRVTSFAPTGSTPQWDHTFTLPVDFGWYGLRISPDGSRISANSKYTGWVLDAATGNPIWEVQTNNTEAPIPLSQDGSVLAIGSNAAGTCKVYTWNTAGQTYDLLWTYTFTGGFSRWCSEVEVSADGNTVAAGSLEFITMNSYDGHAAVFDTWGTGVPLWVSSAFGDLVGEIAISDDGQVIAVGSWGHLDNSTPDLRVYERAGSTPFFTINSPGSINSVDMTPDGSKIFAGGKHVHNRTFGNGGDAYAIQIAGDLPQVSVTLTPINPPIVIPPSGGSFSYNGTVNNDTTITQNFDLWVLVTLPNGTIYGPVLGPLDLSLPGSASITRVRNQTVPGGAPSGLYHYTAYVGSYPDGLADSSSFTFSKSGDGGGPAGGWACTGEPFPGEIGGPSASRRNTALPEEVALSASPNPFNPTTVASYELRAASYVSLKVYDTAGCEVATLVNGWREAGVHEVAFDGSGLASGVYLVMIQAGDYTQTQKLILLK
ncbi:MAG: T9SS C-terminal target domain-containing protein [Candidatus Zixiibacteriota bacterium]|nr:MAG: T9SS C-terminal target domain-containing protein [candidate division Zixibacteria bacterium]